MKGLRKLVSLIAVTAMLTTGFVGCSKNDAKGKEQSKNGKEIKVGVALYKFDDTFISTVRQAIEKEAQTLGKEKDVKITVNPVDGQGQQATQNDQIDTFINQKYDVLAVNMVDRTAASVIIDKAKKEDIPVVFFNREPVKEDMNKWDKLYYVGAKAEESGTMQGELIGEYWKKHKEADRNKDGKLQYVMLEGEPGHQDAILRTQFSVKALDEAGIKSEKLASDTANWQRAQGQEKMAAWLSSYGDKIEAVFANNDDMALGAIEALKAAGYFNGKKSIPVVGVDATAPALDSLKEDKLYGTILNDANNQGKYILDMAYDLAKKEDVAKDIEGITDGKYKWVPYQPITKENVSKVK
ncbi:galactose ABC transporter substrate-binding protein [Hathewaya limosa]|uniref:D-galactose/methyl-galactoside binding periplasmic protein MglB n=1 Tax=Hathewaya limosa TaxID=1536 RepID=A0ABU0JR17_HATLI|nr:galactose ABC transporter substrate-binding protein [Hathewaya limosa]MDQ0478347.1 methyl-galactoside transport system substrate-binding protein [Hathewaya limosa]